MDFFANFLNILWWSLWMTIWIMFIFLIIKFVIDAWRDEGIGVLAKILWTLFLVCVPVLGALVYLLARGRGMAARDMAAARGYRAEEVDYTRSLMYDDADIEALTRQPSAEIARAKALLDSGAITADEYETLKARALG
ncbi:SHOCT domain-containing protein [Demequina sp. SYSU T00192]|uniref:SHOCT domain-containing protein n=1 Tax=Demequina litoralis TaxID=3051660 RepID=A0ABT8G7H2_9MICO|nr:SHOCT domain-containing protein [Demequina sp. SYSU T00192]MDN4475097.1 SHOCT domain-containing protein [Demequina sp. SYSU T00192]